MANNLAEQHIKIVVDISERLHLAVMKLHLGADAIQPLRKQPSVWVTLPLRINLLWHPGNKLISSAEMKQTFLFTPHEVHTIETYAAHHHFSKEDALQELIKVSLQDHKSLWEIIRRSRRKSSKETHIEVVVQLWGSMSWDEKRAENTTS